MILPLPAPLPAAGTTAGTGADALSRAPAHAAPEAGSHAAQPGAEEAVAQGKPFAQLLADLAEQATASSDPDASAPADLRDAFETEALPTPEPRLGAAAFENGGSEIADAAALEFADEAETAPSEQFVAAVVADVPDPMHREEALPEQRSLADALASELEPEDATARTTSLAVDRAQAFEPGVEGADAPREAAEARDTARLGAAPNLAESEAQLAPEPRLALASEPGAAATSSASAAQVSAAFAPQLQNAAPDTGLRRAAPRVANSDAPVGASTPDGPIAPAGGTASERPLVSTFLETPERENASLLPSAAPAERPAPGAAADSADRAPLRAENFASFDEHALRSAPPRIDAAAQHAELRLADAVNSLGAGANSPPDAQAIPIGVAPVASVPAPDMVASLTANPNTAAQAAAAQAISQRVEVLASQGGGVARIRLHPPELGQVELSVRVNGNAVEVTMRVEEVAVQAAAHGARDRLVETLAARDLQIENFEVSTFDGRSANNGARDGAGGTGQGRGTDLGHQNAHRGGSESGEAVEAPPELRRVLSGGTQVVDLRV